MKRKVIKALQAVCIGTALPFIAVTWLCYKGYTYLGRLL